LQPAQLLALHELHPEDKECVIPSLPRETPLKQELSCSTSFDWQSGQLIPFSEEEPRISFSNTELHFRHLYSKIGIAVFTFPS